MTSTQLLLALFLSANPAPDSEPKPRESAVDASADSKAILEAIQREREQLARERAELEATREDIKRAEAEIESKLTKLERAIEERQAVEKAILAAKEVLFSARLARLVEITSKMSAEKSSAYLQNLPEGTAVSILEGLQPRKAALILSLLPPSKAAKLSRIYLKREHNADTRRDADGNEERVAAPE
ncbi:MAG: hypothetical protein RIT81_10255 [Deltaproteobacteria bacterium]